MKRKALITGIAGQVLCGEASQSRRDLKWKSEVTFRRLVEMTVDHDRELLSSAISLPSTA